MAGPTGPGWYGYIPPFTETPQQQATVQNFFATRGPWTASASRTDPENPRTLRADPEWVKDYLRLEASLNLPPGRHIDPQTGEIVKQDFGDFLREVIPATIITFAGAYTAGQVLSALGEPASTGTFAGGLDSGATAGVDAGTTAATSGSVAAPTTVGGLTTPGVGTVATSPAWTTAGSGISGATATGTTAGTAGTFSNFVNGMGGYRGLVGIGTNLVGSYLQSRAANNATDAQLAAAREALAQEAQQYNTNTGLNVAQANQNTQAYNTTVANLAPYRGIGAAAASMAGYSLGLPGYQNGRDSVVNAPPPITPIQPLAVPPPISVNGQPGQAIPNQAFLPTNQKTNGQPQMSTGNSWSSPAAKGPTGQMVTMQAPTGQVAQVPASQVQYYQQQGAKLLSTSSVQTQGAA